MITALSSHYAYFISFHFGCLNILWFIIVASTILYWTVFVQVMICINVRRRTHKFILTRTSRTFWTKWIINKLRVKGTWSQTRSTTMVLHTWSPLTSSALSRLSVKLTYSLLSTTSKTFILYCHTYLQCHSIIIISIFCATPSSSSTILSPLWWPSFITSLCYYEDALWYQLLGVKNIWPGSATVL